jgi:hypothetical protein
MSHYFWESGERFDFKQVHRSFFTSLLGVRASTSGVSILGEFGRIPLFVDRVRAISFYYNRLLRLRDSGRLVSLAFEDSIRLAEEVEFMLHSTALPKSCLPPTLVRGWFGDAMAILGRAYRRPCIRSFPECDTSSISSYMQHQYLTGPHGQGPIMAIYDSIWDGKSYGCDPYICTQYFTEAYRKLARFRTGSHDLAGITGRWMRSSTSFADEHRICLVCRLHTVEDDDHFIFECLVYRFLRMVKYSDLFVGHRSLRSFMGQAGQSRVASSIRGCFRSRTHVRTLVS